MTSSELRTRLESIIEPFRLFCSEIHDPNLIGFEVCYKITLKDDPRFLSILTQCAENLMYSRIRHELAMNEWGIWNIYVPKNQ